MLFYRFLTYVGRILTCGSKAQRNWVVVSEAGSDAKLQGGGGSSLISCL